MNPTAYELALIAGGFGIAGTLIGVLGTYRLSMKLADRQFQQLREISKLDAWHVAAHEFIAAFSSDLATLESGAKLGVDLSEFFRAAYDSRHSQAFALFEQFIPEAKRAAFKRAWKSHCYGVDSDGRPRSPDDEDVGMNHDMLLFLHYSYQEHHANPASPRTLGIRAIQNLLSYAVAS